MLKQEWKDTISKSLKEPGWDQYDSLIKAEVAAYNSRFKTDVDWTIIKAMVWVESGGRHNPAWKTRPMQIGNPGDHAYDVLRHGKENSPLIMSADLAKDIRHNSMNEPTLNIRAGLAYLFTRMARFASTTVLNPLDSGEHEYTVLKGDSLVGIAHKVGTTVEILQQMNNQVLLIHPHQTLKYQKAKHRMMIVGWLKFTTQNIADRYNGGGDPDYREKLDYALGLLLPGLLLKTLPAKKTP